MLEKSKIAVVIPYYNAAKHIKHVVGKLPDFIDAIYVVDDCSPEPLPNVLTENTKIVIIKNKTNLGVGGATKEGFKKAITDSMDIVVKLDADDQMDTSFIPALVEPLMSKTAEYAKGNRFRDFKSLNKMPFVRKAGNLILSFLVKAATGYWNNFDPTNGFFAINVNTLKQLEFTNISNRYYFETSLIAELYFQEARIKDISMPAIYGDETSSMSVWKMPFVFLPRLCKTFIKRIVKSYFLYDFNMSSVYLLLGIPLFLFGFTYGLYTWWFYSSKAIFAPTGTIMLVTLTIILGFQLLLQAIHYDITKAPKPVK
ncbi:glycosyltransferase family 2 protein [Jejuia pallidilutea]|uniref:Glycosyl transferase group 2 family protein n=1 Tax=Jejuia pallidilutea TaxID=504487 RepID=A0A090W7H5_9FLAO|nr:glycosyltransferase family 2 protein [Jejuia pallidilutea]GAL67596.1 glycosyl transferase group 2 family protein [Jejuia pallidilutea]GAL71404.1 glycosyl transferase group 2 family protein [Jejuia pallidilutea]GAL89419.1 glycosyl transferase group 2 family protein [Jejuia pallidilutea]